MDPHTYIYVNVRYVHTATSLSLSLSLSLSIYIYTYVYVYQHIHAYICIDAYTYTCTHALAHICRCIYIYNKCISIIHACAHTCTYTTYAYKHMATPHTSSSKRKGFRAILWFRSLIALAACQGSVTCDIWGVNRSPSKDSHCGARLLIIWLKSPQPNSGKERREPTKSLWYRLWLEESCCAHLPRPHNRTLWRCEMCNPASNDVSCAIQEGPESLLCLLHWCSFNFGPLSHSYQGGGCA